MGRFLHNQGMYPACNKSNPGYHSRSNMYVGNNKAQATEFVEEASAAAFDLKPKFF
jgi:hypothetical protein